MKKSRLSRDAPTQSVDPDSVGISRLSRDFPIYSNIQPDPPLSVGGEDERGKMDE